MPQPSNTIDDFEIIRNENAGPSETAPGNGGGTNESVQFLDLDKSPFDQEPSRIFEGILQEAASSKDYAHARREALDLIEQYGMHDRREQVFGLLDRFESGNGTEPEDIGDKGKGRDERERPKRRHDELADEGPREKRRRTSVDGGGSDAESTKSDEETGKLVFPWTNKSDRYAIHRNYRNLPLATKTNEIREHHLRHKKKALKDLKSQISKPPFPMSLWEAILVNQYVDFNKLHAIQGGQAVDEEVVHESGKFKFVFNQIESKATIYAFPHREGELQAYRRYIQTLFKGVPFFRHRASTTWKAATPSCLDRSAQEMDHGSQLPV